MWTFVFLTVMHAACALQPNSAGTTISKCISEKDFKLGVWVLTWAALMGLGCPQPGLEECRSPRSTALAGSPCSGRPPQVQGTLPAVCPQGGVSRPTLGPHHKDLYFQEACAAWWASVLWLGTCNWGWRCRGWYRCHCHWNLPWRRGPALAPRGPGGRTICHHYGC